MRRLRITYYWDLPRQERMGRIRLSLVMMRILLSKPTDWRTAQRHHAIFVIQL